MYGLRHKHIRIEDQQLNLKMNKMPKLITTKLDNIFNTHGNFLISYTCFGELL